MNNKNTSKEKREYVDIASYKHLPKKCVNRRSFIKLLFSGSAALTLGSCQRNPVVGPAVTALVTNSPDTPTPNRVEVNPLTSTPEILWGEMKMGKLGFSDPTYLELVPNLETIIVDADGEVVNKYEGYELKAGETTVKDAILEKTEELVIKGGRYFNKKEAGVLMFNITDKSKKKVAPLVLVVNPAVEDPVNLLDIYWMLGQDERGNITLPSKGGTEITKAVRIGQETKEEKIYWGVLNTDSNTLLDPPLFEFDTKNNKAVFIVPPFSDVRDKPVNKRSIPLFDTSSIRVESTLTPLGPENPVSVMDVCAPHDKWLYNGKLKLNSISGVRNTYCRMLVDSYFSCSVYKEYFQKLLGKDSFTTTELEDYGNKNSWFFPNITEKDGRVLGLGLLGKAPSNWSGYDRYATLHPLPEGFDGIYLDSVKVVVYSQRDGFKDSLSDYIDNHLYGPSLIRLPDSGEGVSGMKIDKNKRLVIVMGSENKPLDPKNESITLGGTSGEYNNNVPLISTAYFLDFVRILNDFDFIHDNSYPYTYPLNKTYELSVQKQDIYKYFLKFYKGSDAEALKNNDKYLLFQ